VGSDGKTVVTALADALADEKGRVRMEAAYALGTIGAEAKSAAPALKKAVGDKFAQVRVAARLALWRATGDQQHMDLAVTEAAVDKDKSTFVNSSVWLGNLGPPVVPILVTRLKNPEPRIREFAALTLGQIQPAPKQAVPALIAVLKDPDPDVRRCVAETLRLIDPEAARKAGVK
jgi:HEAT repeat protein